MRCTTERTVNLRYFANHYYDGFQSKLIDIDNNKERVGLVISAPSNMLYPLTASPDEESFCFWAYDIMLGGELITGVPQEFMIFYFEQEDL